MTIDSHYTQSVKQYSGQTVFKFTFESIGSSGIEVFQVLNGVRTQLTGFVDYVVTLDKYRNPIYRSGVVRLKVALPSGAILSIERKTPITNDFLAEEFLPFEPEQFEHQLGRFTMVLQEIEAHACDCRGEE